MPSIDTYRKHAKLLVRQHREGDHSVGGKVRQLARFSHLTDREALDRPMPLALAQEIVAVEAGFADWAALKSAGGTPAGGETTPEGLSPATPVLFVADVERAAAWYVEALGFGVDFLHGKPAFYGSVSRDRCRLHLRHVHRPPFADVVMREDALILALVETDDLGALYAGFVEGGAEIVQRPTKQAWGGTDLHVRDPDGNVIGFFQRAGVRPAAAAAAPG